MVAAIAVAVMCAPGTWLRTDVPKDLPVEIAVKQISGPLATPDPTWRIEGIWQYSARAGHRFGGFSALLSLDDETLLAFSDQGFRFTFTSPDSAEDSPKVRRVEFQTLGDEPIHGELRDIESATRNPATGDYWLGYEGKHAIVRFTSEHELRGLSPVDQGGAQWTRNGGLEAMLRLPDGRFLAIPERRSYVMLYPSDPLASLAEQRIAFENPEPDFAVTDMAQLPDGRVLMLMRAVVRGLPPFAGLLAIADAPGPGGSEPMSPRIIMGFDGVLPAENYEGIAVRQQDDGRIAVWIISDDNFSVLQRTLLAKLVFDPRQTDGG